MIDAFQYISHNSYASPASQEYISHARNAYMCKKASYCRPRKSRDKFCLTQHSVSPDILLPFGRNSFALSLKNNTALPSARQRAIERGRCRFWIFLVLLAEGFAFVFVVFISSTNLSLSCLLKQCGISIKQVFSFQGANFLSA